MSALQNTIVYCLMIKNDHVIHEFNRISGLILVGIWIITNIILCYRVYIWQITKQLKRTKDFLECLLEERIISTNTSLNIV